MTDWPRGLNEGLKRIEPLVTQSYQEAVAARRRLWAARDDVNRLKKQLATAEAEVAAGEREDAEAHKTMRMIWEDWRDQVMAIPVVEKSASSLATRT